MEKTEHSPHAIKSIISVKSPDIIDKHEHLTGQNSVPSGQNLLASEQKFGIPPLEKILENNC